MYNDSVITFGGFVGGERSNLVHSYDTKKRQWQSMKPESGPEPAPRAGHSAAIHGSWMYVFGGKGEENTKFNDFWKFNLE